MECEIRMQKSVSHNVLGKTSIETEAVELIKRGRRYIHNDKPLYVFANPDVCFYIQNCFPPNTLALSPPGLYLQNICLCNLRVACITAKWLIIFSYTMRI